MASYGITSTGPNIKRLNTIISELAEDIGKDLGIVIDTNSQTVLNLLITNFADKLEELWEFGEEIYYSQYPSTATGVNLDNVCQLAGITREKGKPTRYQINCIGKDGTELNKTTVISSNTSPSVRFFCSDEEPYITREKCNFVAIGLSTSESSYINSSGQTYYKVEIICNGNTSSFESYYKSDDTGTAISKLIGYINTQKPSNCGWSCELAVGSNRTTEDEYIAFIADNARDVMKIRVSDSLSIEYVSSLIEFESEEKGDFSFDTGVITNILASNTNDLIAVNNQDTDRESGYLAETDDELRASYFNKIFSRADRTIYAIKSRLLEEVDEVKEVVCFENPTDETKYLTDSGELKSYSEMTAINPSYSGQSNDTLTPHSILVIVNINSNSSTDMSGDELTNEMNDIKRRIAETIFDNKAAGIATCGDTSYEIEKTKDKITVKFNTAQAMDIYLEIELETNSSEYENDITQTISDLFDSKPIGYTVRASEIEQVLYNTYGLYSTVGLKSSSDATATRKIELPKFKYPHLANGTSYTSSSSGSSSLNPAEAEEETPTEDTE